MSRFNAILLLVLATLGSPAFSADEVGSTTTRAKIIGPVPQPQLPDDIDPATGLSRSTVVRPLEQAAPAPGPAALPRLAPAAPLPGAKPHIALILPTASPALGRLASAVRDGFAAAAKVAGREAPPIEFTATDNEASALLEACRKAQSAGAMLVVAGITRDGATALARSDCPRQPVLALNEPQGLPAPDVPPNLFTISLSLEQEARQVALMAVNEGWRSAVVIGSPSPLARRVQEAFEREWSRAAGELRPIELTGNPEEAPALRDKLARVKADMVFLALDAAEARAVRPYIHATLPVFSTSLSVNPRAEAIVNLDLQGLRYVEMPWFVQPDHPAVMVYPQAPATMSVEEERLYAFGIDALRLSLHMLRGEARRTPLDGVTGRITLEGATTFVRTLTPAEVDGGRVIPLRAP